MKVLAVLVLCAFAAVQGRSAAVSSSDAALGDNPWLVHIRLAVSTSGFLNSCTGSLIDSRWVLTSAACVADARFVWIRYGAVDVISPELVTETSAVRTSTDGRLALVSINRVVQTSDNVAPVSLGTDDDQPSTANFCAYGDNGSDGPGEKLSCANIELEQSEDKLIASAENPTTQYDLGAPLVVDGVQKALLIKSGDGENAGTFISVSGYIGWIEEETGLSLSA